MTKYVVVEEEKLETLLRIIDCNESGSTKCLNLCPHSETCETAFKIECQSEAMEYLKAHPLTAEEKKAEEMATQILDRIDYHEDYYTGKRACPFCMAEAYGVSMDSLGHKPNCAYLIAKEITSPHPPEKGE